MQQSQPPNTRTRVSLSKHRAEIEQWVGEGRSDDWIADTLGTSRSSVQSFRSRSGILRQRARANGAEAGEEERSTGSPEPQREEASVYEGVLDQGEEGYGLWLDPVVGDDPLFREGFTGVSDVRVVIERGRIVLEPYDDRGPGQSTQSSGAGSEHEAANEKPGQREATNGNDPEPDHTEEAAGSSGETGRVKFFDAAKGYGFIIRPDGGEVFFHKSEIEAGAELDSGEFVLYEPGSSPRGPVAQRVRAVG